MDELKALIVRLTAASIEDHRFDGDGTCDCNIPFSTCNYHRGFHDGAIALLASLHVKED